MLNQSQEYLKISQIVHQVSRQIEIGCKQTLQLSYGPNSRDLQFPLFLSHHLTIILYRLTQNIIREEDADRLKLAVSLIPMLDIISAKKAHWSEACLTFTMQIMQKMQMADKGKVQHPYRLLSLHLKAIQGMVYRTSDSVILALPQGRR